MAERLADKLARLNAPGPLASRCYGDSWARAEDDVLAIYVSPVETHKLLWSRFASSHHIVSVSDERLVLVFLGSQVVVGGLSLERLSEAAIKRRLCWLRSLPSDYRQQRGPNETFVDFLAVGDVTPVPIPDLNSRNANEQPTPRLALTP